MKDDITDNMDALLDIMSKRQPRLLQSPYSLVRAYYNAYPKFTDTNNLSVLYFLSCGSINLCYPGDLEFEGWISLLQNPNVTRELRKVIIYVASHHGRDSGFCELVFNFCKPDVIIISDKEIQYSTQNQIYQPYAKGIITKNGERRRVLTTRNDGRIGIEEISRGFYKVYTGY